MIMIGSEILVYFYTFDVLFNDMECKKSLDTAEFTVFRLLGFYFSVNHMVSY